MCDSFAAEGLASARHCPVDIEEIHNMIRGSHTSFTSILRSIHVDTNSSKRSAPDPISSLCRMFGPSGFGSCFSTLVTLFCWFSVQVWPRAVLSV